jgi:preprotein translocase subunit SecD
VRRTRGLWASIIFVAVLVLASLGGFASGKTKPKLGLDLQGGVAVILSAPDGTPKDVMEQALENIRNRVDAFGVGESASFVSGNTITVQIPGGGNGTIEQRNKVQYCLIGSDGSPYGCGPDVELANEALKDLKVQSQPAQVCIVDPAGKQAGCFSTQSAADSAKAQITVAPKTSASSSVSPTSSASPSASGAPAGPSGAEPSCLVDPTGKELVCYRNAAAATTAKDGLKTKVTQNTYCLIDKTSVAPTPSPSPSASPSGMGKTKSSPSPTPSGSASSSVTPSGSASPSTSPSPVGSAFSRLDRSTAATLPCALDTKDDATAALAGITVKKETVEFCVTSSGGNKEGCYIRRADAEEHLKEIGIGHLLDVIGQTARLEERQVLRVIQPTDPSYATTTLTCSTPEEQASSTCEPDRLSSKDVFYQDDQQVKYQLGPVVITGADIKKASAALQGGTQTQISTQWVVNFDLTGSGSDAFSDITTKAVSATPPENQIAIVVDRKIISAPVVQSAITGGSGFIQGSFTEESARDLATQLNAGALPVELTRQSVTTVSPTLGQESLRQGIVAGVAGLILLFAYLLFYYRLLGVVAWVGMTIWAILAIALISVAGSQFGYALSLAGIAGLVISLGVTADSYIVFFERLKDEVRNGKSPRSAVQPAFKRAYRTIVAADLVTGIAAVVLYVTAVSSVRGFALTLGVATALDLFVVYFFKRPTVFLISKTTRLVEMRGFGLTSATAADHTALDTTVEPDA